MTETTPDSDVKFPPVVGAGPDEATISPATPGAAVADLPDGVDLVHEHGLEFKSRSQWAYARRRFFRHRLAMASFVVLMIILLAGVFAPLITPYPFAAQDFAHSGQPPTFKAHHYFGTDVLGRDYFSRVVYGIRTSAKVALIVTLVSTIVGTIIGAVAGYYTGWVDNILMRFTDLILTLPALALLLTPRPSSAPATRPGSRSSSPYSSGPGSPASCEAAFSRCARRSLSKRRKQPGPGICASCSGTCSRMPSGRSSSTRP